MSVTILRKVSVSGGTVLRAANNLGDVTTPATARTNLGLGSSNTPTFASLVLDGATASVTLGTATEITTIAATALGGLTITPKGGQTVTVAQSSGNVYHQVSRATQAQGQVGIAFLGGTSSTNWLNYMPAASDTLTWFGASANRMTLDTSGNLGITGNFTASGTGLHSFAGAIGSTGALLAHQTAMGVFSYEGSSITNVVAYGADGSSFGRIKLVSRKGGTGADAVTMLDLTSTGVSCAGSVTTGTPNGGTAGAWKLGIAIVAGTSALLTDRYVELDIGGTLYKLACVSNS